mmetsp:Transcript_12183/g.17769  ORF Transcript_12183/g.17769 Transcript_12183/m.17769 type:complete len:113 (+) Transcript_12183:120-458(+)|eukprot:14851406-Ditylum_brightwellii.AAC.1
MHPLVRDLYKRVLLVGKDYPHPGGLSYVRSTWKTALRNPANCPAYYNPNSTLQEKERDVKEAVKKGRFMVKEMMGVIQLKKYRTLKRRYGGSEREVEEEMERIQGFLKNMDR